MSQSNQLDQKDSLELNLDLASFAGGENTIGQDQELKSNEARVIENWDSDSLGGMIRAKGFTLIADGGVSYSNAPDLLLHHFEGNSIRNYAVIEGDVVRINGSVLTMTDDNKFTSGLLCHGVSAGSKAWITNSTDNLKYTTIGGSITVPPGQPPLARDRIYYHKSRLIAEGGGTTIYGSRAGTGNWASANTWSSSGDAWSIDMPDVTQGLCPNFPSGNEVAVFTKFGAYALNNFPNVGFRPIQPSHGCCAPYSIALGTEGCYYLSNFPTLGVYIWDGTNFVNLTINEDWVNLVNITGRIFGIYRENKYFFFYNETGSGVSYPNVCRYYDARWGKWAKRPINPLVLDNFGYPAVLTKSSNELYIASSAQDAVYQLEDSSNSDNTYPTLANYKTKDFTSRDFGMDIDEIPLKLIKATITYYGSTSQFSLAWNSDRGLHSGQMVFPLTANGDLINTTFIVNTSYITQLPPDRTVIRKFNNNAVGRRFDFQLLNSATGDRTKIKKICILAEIYGQTENITFDTPSTDDLGDTLLTPGGEVILI